MINVQEFLTKINEDSVYAIVKYEDKEELLYFWKIYDSVNGNWYLESPCQLYELYSFEGDNVIEELQRYVKAMYILEDGETVYEFIDKFLKHMIIDKKLYEIVSWQCSPFLPKKVDCIDVISEREALIRMLKESE